MNITSVVLVSLVAIMGFMLCGFVVGASLFPNVPTATIISQNSHWHSDGFTYTNFTVTGNHFIITKCDYYHVGSTVQFQYFAWWIWEITSYDRPVLVEGCYATS